MKSGPDTELLIVRYALVASLTTLIPVPFLDAAVKRAIQRRMVRTLAAEHGIELTEDEIQVLADEHDTPLLGAIVTKVALLPIRWILRRAVIVLTGKAVVDAASDAYHRGFLIDHAFRAELCAPTGPHGVVRVRHAVDEVCKEVVTGPVERAISRGMGPSRAALGKAYAQLRDRLGSAKDIRQADEVESALDSAGVEDERAVGAMALDVLGRIRELPSSTLEDLRNRLLDKLKPRRPSDGVGEGSGADSAK